MSNQDKLNNLFVKCVKNKTVFKKEEIEENLLKGNMGIIKDIIDSGYSLILDMSTESRFYILINDGMMNRSIEHGSEDTLPLYTKFESKLKEENPELFEYYTTEIKEKEKRFFTEGKRTKPAFIDDNERIHYFDYDWDLPLNKVAMQYVCTDVKDPRYVELQEWIKTFIFKESYYLDIFVTMDQRDVNRDFPEEVK